MAASEVTTLAVDELPPVDEDEPGHHESHLLQQQVTGSR